MSASRRFGIVMLFVSVVCAALACFLAVRADAAPAPRQLPGIPDPCDLAPSGPLKDACDAVSGGIGGAVDAAKSGVSDAVGVVGGGIFDQALSWLASTMADTVKGALDGLGQALSNAPQAPVDAAWFRAQYAPLMVAGIGLCFFMLIFHLIFNLARFRTGQLTATLGLFLMAIFLTATAPLFIAEALRFADGITAGLALWAGPQAGHAVDNLAAINATITNSGSLGTVKPLVLILVLFLAVLVSIAWMVMLALRSELILIGTLAIPFVLPSIIDGKARFARLYVRLLFGVIISAPVLFGVLCAGAVIFGQGFAQPGIWALVTGVALMGAAIFLPFVVIKLLVPLAAPVVYAVERGGHRIIQYGKQAKVMAAGFATGGAAGAAMAGAAASGSSTPKSNPPRPAPAPLPPQPPSGRPVTAPAMATAEADWHPGPWPYSPSPTGGVGWWGLDEHSDLEEPM